MGDSEVGGKGRKLGEKSADLLGHPQPVPGSSGQLELGTGTLGQTSPALQPRTLRCVFGIPQTSPALGRSCPGNGSTEPLLPVGSGAAGAAAGILREGRGSCSQPRPRPLAGVAQHLLRKEPVVLRPTGTALLQPSDLQQPPGTA